MCAVKCRLERKMCYHIIPEKYSRRLEKITFIMAFMRQSHVNLSPMHGNICRALRVAVVEASE